MIPRETFATAFEAFVEHKKDDHPLKKRFRASSVPDLSHLRSSSRDSKWYTLDALEDDEREVYFWIVAKHDGVEKSMRVREDYDRIHRPDGVKILVENSGDDPFQIIFTINDRVADAWADANGSLDGGTWEADGHDKSFVYDIGYWRPSLFDALMAEGYNLDFSTWSDPDDLDLEVQEHLSDCGKCDGDFFSGKKHVAKIKQIQQELFEAGS